MGTRLRSGLKLFGSPNWTTELSLVQIFHSGSQAMPRYKGVPVEFLQANLLDVEDKGKLNLVPSFRISRDVLLFPNTHRRYIV